jgi:exo-beta-1,3-glucanase (GH17 family)
MKKRILYFLILLCFLKLTNGLAQEKLANPYTKNEKNKITAAILLGNPDYQAICYGGYRQNTRSIEPTIEDLKEDMKILSAMGIKVIRTYNTQLFPQTANLLKAIRQLKESNPDFEMYVMLGTWIECEGAYSDNKNHELGNQKRNTAEIEAAVSFANTYPDIIKIIAVGNEAMVHWATSYYVAPKVILEWVNYLQELKKKGNLPADVWITSSDNFASWGGGSATYHTKDLEALLHAVDYVSIHTYPFHDSFHNPEFWVVPENEIGFTDQQKVDAAMIRARDYAISQYHSVADYMKSLGIIKPLHIGETGWASLDNAAYGPKSSKAADEYKEKCFYDLMRTWTNKEKISCFYFEAFDENWKDFGNVSGSENHFGLFTLDGKAKYVLWDMVDKGIFNGLKRNGKTITKTYNGNEDNLMEKLISPPTQNDIGIKETKTINKERKAGQIVIEEKYVLVHESLVPNKNNSITFPSEKLKLNAWEGTCSIKMSNTGVITVITGTGSWWGCALEINSGVGENLSNFKEGYLNFDIKGTTASSFKIGFQTGQFSLGTQVNNATAFGPDKSFSLSNEWKTYTIPIPKINNGANLSNVTGILFLLGDSDFDGKEVLIKNIYYSQK